MEQEEIKHEDSMLEKATKLAERIEAANKVTEELVTRQENLRAHEIIAGNTEAGQPEEKPDDYAGARELLKGTGYDELLFPEENK